MNPQTQNNQNIYRIIAFIIVVILAGYLYFMHARKTTDVSTTATTTPTSTTTGSTIDLNSLPVGATTTVNGYTVKVLSNTVSGTAPDYKKPIVCAPTVSAEQCAALKTQAAALQANIAKNGQDLQSWIYLGTLHKSAGDYQTAALYWQYMTQVYPTNPIAFSDLADLYMNFTKDYAKAETNYLAAIKVYPTDTSYYTNLFSLYTTTSYKGAAGAAESILKKGIAANPKSVDLQVALARYYKTLGRSADAKTEYDAAIANAQSQGQTALATEIQQEAIK